MLLASSRDMPRLHQSLVLLVVTSCMLRWARVKGPTLSLFKTTDCRDTVHFLRKCLENKSRDVYWMFFNEPCVEAQYTYRNMY